MKLHIKPVGEAYDITIVQIALCKLSVQFTEYTICTLVKMVMFFLALPWLRYFISGSQNVFGIS
jgi:hypothetical protein